ncbi:DNA-binding protein WhiA [Lachnospiraceae bacterium C1.1]|nr:DNA-binding protein WhiA [Lachnospiraceae bacterium C1.1]
MSFSTDVKKEISMHIPTARHCQIAELAALFEFGGRYLPSEKRMEFQTENSLAAKLYFTLLQKLCTIRCDVQVIRAHDAVYLLNIYGDDAERAAKMLKLAETRDSVNELLVEKMCCKRYFVSGAFLAAGSVNNPMKSYHMEIVCSSENQAEKLVDLINSFGVESRIVIRKKYFVVYLKDGGQIIDMLNIMEAHQALMSMENTRIVKEMRNAVNRRVNCETANITKTVNAAVKQVNDIEYIKASGAFMTLSEPLRQLAELRLAHPEASLKELGSLLDANVSKSGVNHRLRRLSEIAENLRKKG